MRRSLIASLLLSLAGAAGAAATPAPAPAPDAIATLKLIRGSVMINEGTDFVAGQPEQRLKEGDKVMVLDDSFARIVFDDECRLDIEANKMVVVPDRSTCAGARITEQALKPKGQGAIGSASGGPGLLPLVVAAAITGVVLDDDDASP